MKQGLSILIILLCLNYVGHSQQTGGLKLLAETVNAKGKKERNVDHLDITILEQTSGDTIVRGRFDHKSEHKLQTGKYTLIATYRKRSITESFVIKAYRYTFITLEFRRKWWQRK